MSSTITHIIAIFLGLDGYLRLWDTKTRQLLSSVGFISFFFVLFRIAIARVHVVAICMSPLLKLQSPLLSLGEVI